MNTANRLEVTQRVEKASVCSNSLTGWKNTGRKSGQEIFPSFTANTERPLEAVEDQLHGCHVNMSFVVLCAYKPFKTYDN